MNNLIAPPTTTRRIGETSVVVLGRPPPSILRNPDIQGIHPLGIADKTRDWVIGSGVGFNLFLLQYYYSLHWIERRVADVAAVLYIVT